MKRKPIKAAGSTIGSGIFVSPTGVLQSTESVGASLVIWAACAVNTVLCGMSYLEMALLIRESGGTYSYWYECYGKLPAFLICWFWSAMGKKMAGLYHFPQSERYKQVPRK